jgi:hypothetical protein
LCKFSVLKVLSYLEAVADGFPVDKLLGTVTAKVGNHHLVDAEFATLDKPLARPVQVGKDRPNLRVLK